jgi:hypothetical protein
MKVSGEWLNSELDRLGMMLDSVKSALAIQVKGNATVDKETLEELCGWLSDFEELARYAHESAIDATDAIEEIFDEQH